MTFISRRRVGSVLAATMLLLLAVQPAAAATVKFGAKLPASGIFVSNAYPGRYCDSLVDGGSDTYACTWILLDAFNGGADTAPQNGTINKIRILNGAGGSFKVVTARKNGSGQFKVTHMSDKVTYATDPCDFPEECVRHAYNITPLAVATGDYIGIKTKKTSTLRCDSGGSKVALFTPPLVVGGAYTTPTDTDGCWLMVQAVYSN
jgi:hypothetical protein